jgi:hypothetical protein
MVLDLGWPVDDHHHPGQMASSFQAPYLPAAAAPTFRWSGDLNPGVVGRLMGRLRDQAMLWSVGVRTERSCSTFRLHRFPSGFAPRSQLLVRSDRPRPVVIVMPADRQRQPYGQ